MTFATKNWELWSTTAQVTVTEPENLDRAVAIALGILGDIERASSRFRSDSELESLHGKLATGAEVTSRLATLVRAALDVAALTDGTVDPTLGNDMVRIGYDRDLASLPAEATLGAFTIVARTPRTAGWRRISLDGQRLTVPNDLALDLGATAKALAADECARSISAELGCGVLVSLGGDIATSGIAPVEGWIVLVQDLPSDPEQTVTLKAGSAIATSSTQKRRWTNKGRPQHHILDPRFGLPAEPVWKSVTIAADTCLTANALSTAAIVRGRAAIDWLQNLGATGRLVDQAGRIVTVGTWPAAPEPFRADVD